MFDFIVIAGPTSSGKSALALRFCEAMKEQDMSCEIINADSISVFRGFNIGAAKPSILAQKKVPHHLIDIRNPDQLFTAGDFVRETESVLEKLHKKNILPVIVGGIGFYLRALIQGMTEQSEAETEKSKIIRKELYEQLNKTGLSSLYREMLRLDAALENKIHAQDQYRIIRALEMMQATGKKWSQLNEAARNLTPRYTNIRYFCLDIPREELITRIDLRSKKMLEDGLLQEVQNLLELGVNPQCKPIHSIGYKECLEYLGVQEPAENTRRPTTLTELAEKISLETRKLAKRQMTWFRGERNVTWLSSTNFLENILAHF